MSSVAFLASQAEASLFVGMLMLKGSSPKLEGFQLNVGIFSIFLMSVLVRFDSVWRGPQCLLVALVLFQLTGLNSGWSMVRVAILTKALMHHFLIISDAGSRKALAFKASVGDVQRPPVMAKALALCMCYLFDGPS